MSEIVKYTATKANWAGVGGAIVTLGTALIARLTGIVDMPDTTLIEDAVYYLITMGAGYVVTFIVTWLSPANKPKE